MKKRGLNAGSYSKWSDLEKRTKGSWTFGNPLPRTAVLRKYYRCPNLKLTALHCSCFYLFASVNVLSIVLTSWLNWWCLFRLNGPLFSQIWQPDSYLSGLSCVSPILWPSLSSSNPQWFGSPSSTLLYLIPNTSDLLGSCACLFPLDCEACKDKPCLHHWHVGTVWHRVGLTWWMSKCF